jgi:hypothetical protein
MDTLTFLMLLALLAAVLYSGESRANLNESSRKPNSSGGPAALDAFAKRAAKVALDATGEPCPGGRAVDWIADCTRYLRDHGFSRIQAEEDAEDAWVQHNNEVADRTLYPLANSWYVGANIPGKPRVFMPYVGGVAAYKRKCDEIAARGYDGFRFGVYVEDQRFAAD